MKVGLWEKQRTKKNKTFTQPRICGPNGNSMFCSESKEIELPEVIKQKFYLIKPIFKTVSVRWIHCLSNLMIYFNDSTDS